jgi:hypothetical protein
MAPIPHRQNVLGGGRHPVNFSVPNVQFGCQGLRRGKHNQYLRRFNPVQSLVCGLVLDLSVETIILYLLIYFEFLIILLFCRPCFVWIGRQLTQRVS